MAKEAVGDYLETCKEENIVPEKPFKGSLNIRIGADLHQELALSANRKNMSLNNLICDILKDISFKNRLSD